MIAVCGSFIFGAEIAPDLRKASDAEGPADLLAAMLTASVKVGNASWSLATRWMVISAAMQAATVCTVSAEYRPARRHRGSVIWRSAISLQKPSDRPSAIGRSRSS